MIGWTYSEVPRHWAQTVQELFQVVEEHLPSIMFNDEIDAIRTKMYDSDSGGEREIQWTILELLHQWVDLIQGETWKLCHKPDINVGSHTYQTSLHDRKIRLPLPNERTKKCIYRSPTSRKTLTNEVTLDDLIMTKHELSGADVKAISTEAGLMALREYRMKVKNEDFKKSKEDVLYIKTRRHLWEALSLASQYCLER